MCTIIEDVWWKGVNSFFKVLLFGAGHTTMRQRSLCSAQPKIIGLSGHLAWIIFNKECSYLTILFQPQLQYILTRCPLWREFGDSLVALSNVVLALYVTHVTCKPGSESKLQPHTIPHLRCTITCQPAHSIFHPCQISNLSFGPLSSYSISHYPLPRVNPRLPPQ